MIKRKLDKGKAQFPHPPKLKLRFKEGLLGRDVSQGLRGKGWRVPLAKNHKTQEQGEYQGCCFCFHDKLYKSKTKARTE